MEHFIMYYFIVFYMFIKKKKDYFTNPILTVQYAELRVT